jgi:serine/threonine protein kinase
MFLYAGSVEEHLAANPTHRRDSVFLDRVFSHILRSLMFIVHHGIIHRDVKSANILYDDTQKGEIRFVLADFGLSKEQVLARTVECGTPIYMAPEVCIPGAHQSHKIDVYSLGVTMLAIGGAGGFDENKISSRGEISTAIKAGLRDDTFSSMAPLLHQKPAMRPSAQDIFLSIWHHDPEAIRLSPQESEQAEQAAATVQNQKPIAKKRKQSLRMDGTRGPTSITKPRQQPAAAPKRAQRAVVLERQTPQTNSTTTAAELFSQLLNEPPRARRFT